MNKSAIIHKIHNISRPVLGEIWCLHRVLLQRSWAKENRELEITPEFLERIIINYLHAGCRFSSLEKVLNECYRFPWQGKLVNISFDDGFKDVYQYAFPIFKKYDIPFTIYVTTSFPDGKALPWWILLEELEKSQESFSKAIGQIYASNVTPEVAFKMMYQEPLSMMCNPIKELSLSWDELSEMLDSGLLTVGSHTVTHPMLSKIDIDAIRKELCDSKKRIREMLGIDVKHFSYPHSSYMEQVVDILRQEGYESAVLGYGGTIRKGDDDYLLNRKYIVQE